MKDINVLNKLERQIGIKLKKIQQADFNQSVEASYAVDQDDYVTHLSIPLVTKSSLPFSRLAVLKLEGFREENIESLEFLSQISTLILYRVDINDGSIFRKFSNLIDLRLTDPVATDFAFLKNLTSLETLHLSIKTDSDISAISHLSKLTSLTLQSSGITNVSFIAQLKNLRSLNLYGNDISNISALSGLINLTELTLRRNKLRDISAISNLSNLEKLDLSHNELENASIIGRLKALRRLILVGTKLEDASFISQLKNIEFLNLSQNAIKNAAFLAHLDQLWGLDMSFNQLSEFILYEGLGNIQSLKLGNNALSTISFLTIPRNLSNVYLNNNDFTSYPLPSSIKSLDLLDLSDNKLSGSLSLMHIERISQLILDNNALENIHFPRGLKSFRYISMAQNRLSDISVFLNLENIKTLDLRRNNITLIPEAFFDLPIPVDVTTSSQIFYTHGVFLYGNNIESPPIEIIAKGDVSVKNYFQQLTEQGTEVLYEGKILIVGEGGAGKTTLFKKLQDPKELLPDTISTLGVEIKEGQQFVHPENNEISIRGNLWDFGGQEIQYQLHQYFITPDSLYILVADNRKENTRWDYWFQIIRLLGGPCHVLVVLNHNKVSSMKSSFARDEYQRNFKELFIEEVSIDFSVNDYAWTYLQDKIKLSLANLPLVNKPVPGLWKPLRQKLEEERQRRNYITISDFKSLCQQIGILRDEFMLQALDYFNAIGIVLHFQKDISLQDIIFLNPNWITKGIYSALSKSNVEIENGCFTREWIEQFWQAHENNYSFEDRTYLLRLMLKDKFDICYPLNESNSIFMVPMLLPDKVPPYQFNYANNLHFRFQYPFMPEGIISRLMVRLHSYISHGLSWKKGVLFERKNTDIIKAEVIQKSNPDTGLRYIGIKVSGKHPNDRKDFLYKIREQLYHIHESSFKEIRYSEMVACNCETCRSAEQPNFYPLESLQNLVKRGSLEKQCDRSGDFVPITELIGAVYPAEEAEAKLMNRKSEYDIMQEELRSKDQHKKSGTILALITLVVCLAVIVGAALLLSYFKVSVVWFVLCILFVLLAIPTIWSFAVSPNEISEQGAIRTFDNVLRKLNIFKKISDKSN